MSRRITSLDSLRGVASFIVLLSHAKLMFPKSVCPEQTATILQHVIDLFTNGEGSVIIFFMLSGYVLALPFLTNTQLGYPRYAAKRFCRIYIPFAVVVLLAFLLTTLVNLHDALAEAGSLPNTQVNVTPKPSVLLGHFVMTGTKQDIALDSVMWSLVYELRVSFILPLLVVLCRKTWLALLTAFILLFMSNKALFILGQTAPWDNETFWITGVWTARMLPYFICGILLSKHFIDIHTFIQRWLSMPMLIPMLSVPLVIFSFPYPSYLSTRWDILYEIGAAFAIILAVDVSAVARVLDHAAIQWLGRISYSLYLIHIPMLVLLYALFSTYLPISFIVLAGVAISLPVATVLHQFVEVPSVRLGRRLATPAGLSPPLDVPSSGVALREVGTSD